MARILVTGSEGFIGKHLVKALSGHEVIECDVHTKELTGPFDGIIHLAAVSRVRDAEADRIKCLETNILFTAQLLEFKPEWFIFASTMEPPTNVYGYSKRAAEDYIQLRCKKYVILRLANVIGPGMAEDKLLPMIRAGKVKELRDGVLPFHYIHVDEVVDDIERCVQNNAWSSYMIELRSGIASTKEELLRVAASY